MAIADDRIGPYRVLGVLGSGGMGEVLLAEDLRLGRRVAIKRLADHQRTSSKRRERLLREARLAASLNHPSIVQVHDIQALEDGHCIVMELVEGPSLRELQEQGNLSLASVVGMGIEIASGLAAAHQQGVVHRDLKTENVLVTPEGRAKISDFGIARWMQGDSGEQRLTATGAALGTSRCMSPEQARGEEVDHRSDLFSLGVLLYEVLGGRNPFQNGNELSTLQRILTLQPVPLQSLRGDLPDSLADLVDQLLHKEPELRPRSAAEAARRLRVVARNLDGSEDTAQIDGTTGAQPAVATSAGSTPFPGGTPSDTNSAPVLGAKIEPGPARSGRFFPHPLAASALLLAILATLAVFLVRGFAARGTSDGRLDGGGAAVIAPKELPVLAVAVPLPRSEDSEVSPSGQLNESYQLVAVGLRHALISSLLDLHQVRVRQVSEVDGAAGGASLGIAELAKAVFADEVLDSSLRCRGEQCQVSLSRVDAAGNVLAQQAFAVPVDRAGVQRTTSQHYLRLLYPDHAAQQAVDSALPDGEDLSLFLRILQRADNQEPPAVLLPELAALRLRLPSFVGAQLLQAELLRRRFYQGRDREDLSRASNLLEQAHRLAPLDPRPLALRFRVSRAAGDLAAAEQSLRQLTQVLPGSALVDELQASLIEEQGLGPEGLELMRRAAEREPTWKRLYNLASMERRQGHGEAARHTLEKLLQRAPDQPLAQAMLAQLEMVEGDLGRAVQLYSALAASSASVADRSNQALALLLSGRYAEAAELYEQVYQSNPENPYFALNLADSRLLLGQDQLATQLYQRVLNLLPEERAAAWQEWTVRAQALAHLGRSRQAVAAVQQALQRAPGNGQVAFESALVYALVGERTSALAAADQARQSGIAARWFQLPWFDDVRADLP